MACDNCPRKYSSNYCILELFITTKPFKSSPCRPRFSNISTLRVLFIALLHVCLFVDCEALKSSENGLSKHMVRHKDLLLVSDTEQSAVILANENLDAKVARPSPLGSVLERSPSKSAKLHVVKRQAPGNLNSSSTGSNGASVQTKGNNAAHNSTSSAKSGANSAGPVQKAKDPGNSKVIPAPPAAAAVNSTQKFKASNDTGQTSEHSEGDELAHGPSNGLKPDAILRLFYVFVVVGVIVLIYILIKFLRFRRKRATRKYRVLSHTDEQEMFPLAADDGDDEEIFNAADHQTLK